MAYDDGNFFTISFGVDGAPTDTQFLAPGGTAATSANESDVLVFVACAVRRIDVIQVVAPGGVVVSSYTLRDDGADTLAVATVTGVATTGNWTGHIAIAAGSLLSMRYDESAGSTTDEVGVIVQLHPFVG